MNISIKKESLSEKASILFELETKIFVCSYHRKVSSLDEFINNHKDTVIYIAYLKDQPIGFMTYKLKDKHIEISDIGVLPEFQGKGIGHMLIDKLFEVAGKKPIEVLTNPQNSSAVIFYLKHGFELKAWKENYYNNGQPRVLLTYEK